MSGYVHEEPRDQLITTYFDHVFGNETKQEIFAVYYILEAVLGWLRVEMPTLTVIWILSDNATCYQNIIV